MRAVCPSNTCRSSASLSFFRSLHEIRHREEMSRLVILHMPCYAAQSFPGLAAAGYL